MAKREVELVIRARDQAKAAIDKFNEALNELGASEERVGKSAAEANSILGRLGTSLRGLQRQAQGLTALNRIANQMDRASGSVARLETSSEKAQQELGQLGQRAQSSAAGFQVIQTEAAQASAVLDRQRTTLAEARAAQAQTNEAVTQAGERYRNLRNELLKSSQSSDTLKESVRDQQRTLLQLIDAQERANQAVAEQRARVREAEGVYRALAAQVKSAGREVDKSNAAFERGGEAAAREAAALEQARTALAEIRQVAQGAANGLGGVEVRQEAIAEASRRTAQAIREVTTALTREQAAARNAAGGVAGGAAAQATAQFRAQVQAVREAEQAWREARNAANALGSQIAQTAEPTAELVAQFALAQQASAEAGREFNDQRESLARLRQATRETADAARAKVQADREAAVLAAHTADAEARRARAEQVAAGAARLLRIETTQLNSALTVTGGAAARGAAGINGFGDSSRRALSLTQRFRGEVLALTTSVFGLYAAVTQIGGVISALRAVEAAASRLNAVFGGDQSRIRAELRFLSQEADRLGLSFRVLSQEYGRFAVAANAANFSADATREIFVSVAEAARVNKASTEELEGIYLALQQIISKGNVTMEELRRQLGDRLPGAFNIFADALGVSTEELNKMIAAGEVAATEDTLLKFARELERRFGGALPAALRTTTTEIDRFSNNLFEAQNRVAQGGFADALRDALIEINDLFRSREGRDFFLQLGAVLGNLVRVLSFVVQNMDLVFAALQAVVAVKAGQFFLNLAQQGRAAAIASREMAAAFLANDAAMQKQIVTTAVATNATGAFVAAMRVLVVTTGQAATALVVSGRGSAAFASAMAAVRAAAAGAAIAVRGLLVALGPIAIAAAAAYLLIDLFTDMSTEVPDATRALDEHTRQLDKYTEEVRRAEDAGRDFNATLVGVSAIEARANLDELSAAYANLRQEAIESAEEQIKQFRRTNRELRDNPIFIEVAELVRQYKATEVSTAQFTQRLQELFGEIEGEGAVALNGLVAGLSAANAETQITAEAIAEQAAITQQLGVDVGNIDNLMRVYGITIDETTGAIGRFTDGSEAAAAAARDQAEALERIENGIPRIADARDRARQRSVLEEDAVAALAGVTDEAEIQRITDLINERREALEEEFRLEDERQNRRDRRNDPQRQYNEDLERANELRRFEITLIGQTQREQEILRTIFQAQQRAQERGLVITQEQIEAIRESAGAAFDAAEAERVRNLTLDQQIKLREALGEQQDIQAQLEAEARAQNIDLLTEEGQAWADVTRRILEREEAERLLAQAVEEVRALERQRVELQRDLTEAENAGESRQQLEERRAQLEQLANEIIRARDGAIEMATALGDEKAVATLQKINTELEIENEKLFRTKDINEQIASGLAGVTGAFAESIAAGDGLADSFDNALLAFRKFASEFLLKIAEMILQALFLRAIQNTGLGGLISGAGNAVAGVAHRGGIAGHGLPKRIVDASWFEGARRFHDGGVAGLSSGEVPAVLQEGEEVLTESDPRHRNNGGGMAGRVSLKIVNAIDAGDFVSEGLSTPVGEEAVMNFIRSNKNAINGALDGG